jgi:TolB protein
MAAQEKTGIFSGSTDVGATKAGSTAFDPATRAYHVVGGGADMWGSADAFHMSWVKLEGDATITADVSFPPGVKVPLEKAVLIFRQSLAPGSAYADVAIHGDGHVTLQYRSAEGAKTEDTTSTVHRVAERPTRLRIERHGDQFTISAGSADGALTASAPVTISLKGPVYAGIGVCAHDANGLASVTFSSVRIERASK